MNLPDPLPFPTLPSDAHELRSALRAILRGKGPIIDPPGMKALYAPLIAACSREGVRCERDLMYGEAERQRLDIYRPESTSDLKSATLVFVHGGGFMRGDKSERSHIGYTLAKRGWLTVLPNYRLAPAHGWPSGAQDVAAVCQWLREHYPELAQRPLVLIGESAGAAHVAAALLCNRFGAMRGWNRYGAALISGTYNPALEALAADQLGMQLPDVRNEAYFGKDSSTWSQKSVINLIDAKPFPLLLTYAELDPLQFQVGASELFARLIQTHGFAPELHLVRGHNHLSQLFAMGTADDALREPLDRFINSV